MSQPPLLPAGSSWSSYTIKPSPHPSSDLETVPKGGFLPSLPLRPPSPFTLPPAFRHHLPFKWPALKAPLSCFQGKSNQNQDWEGRDLLKDQICGEKRGVWGVCVCVCVCERTSERVRE